LARPIGKGKALEFFVAAEKVTAQRALKWDLLTALQMIRWLRHCGRSTVRYCRPQGP
jgi:enoyl-CoA hydratase/carnithine racemase